MSEVITQEQARGQSTASSLVLNSASMDSMLRMAEVMAAGAATVPKHLQGKPSDCLAIIMQAMQWGMNPFSVGQKTHLVNGFLGYEAQLVNAVVQASNSIDGSFIYEYDGKSPGLKCRVGARLRGEKDIRWSSWLSDSDVTTKNSPLWKTNPAQQLAYLQVKNWARLYCPGAILGVYTPDELESKEPLNMGSVELVKAEPAKYPQADFEANIQKWKKAIADGKKTADEVIATVETRGWLTEEQKLAIKTPIEPAMATAQEEIYV